MLPIWGYVLVFGLLLLGLLSSLFQMGSALDELDFDRFFIWTCIAAAIAGVPTFM